MVVDWVEVLAAVVQSVEVNQDKHSLVVVAVDLKGVQEMQHQETMVVLVDLVSSSSHIQPDKYLKSII